MKRLTSIGLTSLLLAIMVLGLACSGEKGSTSEDPKQVVISFFGAMQKNDKPALAHLLDLVELMKSGNTDYALQTDKPRTFTSPEEILDDLTDDGLTKTRWFSMQRIINEAKTNGDNAFVEVTFVDKDASKGYRTTFGLHKIQGKWRIYSFNVYQGKDEG